MHDLAVKWHIAVLIAVSVFLAPAAIAQGESKKLSLDPTPANPYLNPYEVKSFAERLEVFRDGKPIGVIRSENSGIERWGFIDSGNHIVIKLRDVKGLAIFELYDAASCTQMDRWVMPADQKQAPAWVAAFID